MKIDKTIPAYEPATYKRYIESITKDLVVGLKNGSIDEGVFASTYAKYQTLIADNEKAYKALPSEFKHLIDQVSQAVLSIHQEKSEVEELRKEVAHLRSQNNELRSQNNELKREVSKMRQYNPWSYDLPWRITL